MKRRHGGWKLATCREEWWKDGQRGSKGQPALGVVGRKRGPDSGDEVY